MGDAPGDPPRKTAATVGSWALVWALMLLGLYVMMFLAAGVEGRWQYAVFAAGVGIYGASFLLAHRTRAAARGREDRRE